MNHFSRYAGFAALPLLLLLPLAAQDSKKDSKKKDTGITSEQAEQILDELRQIRQLLQQQGEKNGPPALSRAKLDLQGFQMLVRKTRRSRWWSSPTTSVLTASGSTPRYSAN